MDGWMNDYNWRKKRTLKKREDMYIDMHVDTLEYCPCLSESFFYRDVLVRERDEKN
jgi:hypothetical protein